jgi:hypothetical protein
MLAQPTHVTCMHARLARIALGNSAARHDRNPQVRHCFSATGPGSLLLLCFPTIKTYRYAPGVLWNGFLKLRAHHTKRQEGKAVSSGGIFPKIIWEAQSGQIWTSRPAKTGHLWQICENRLRGPFWLKTGFGAILGGVPKRCPYRPLMAGSRGEMPTGGPGPSEGGTQES